MKIQTIPIIIATKTIPDLLGGSRVHIVIERDKKARGSDPIKSARTTIGFERREKIVSRERSQIIGNRTSKDQFFNLPPSTQLREVTKLSRGKNHERSEVNVAHISIWTDGILCKLY